MCTDTVVWIRGTIEIEVLDYVKNVEEIIDNLPKVITKNKSDQWEIFHNSYNLDKNDIEHVISISGIIHGKEFIQTYKSLVKWIVRLSKRIRIDTALIKIEDNCGNNQLIDYFGFDSALSNLYESPVVNEIPDNTLEEMYYIATRIDDEFKDNPVLIEASKCSSYEDLQEFCKSHSKEINEECRKNFDFYSQLDKLYTQHICNERGIKLIPPKEFENGVI